ncbi:ACT domain-containing protein [Tahibacter harae]|uniref:ACT domain-containing protein n=1 Tax=Tahibacter harae TaxID=2963937 RepID=A0ABT1QPQ9_9GAMM|nr:ACT domain-containing protein [Tahibacter harae]MCQ4164280.1 ACT domain-containing protein [Tahibacter harae]
MSCCLELALDRAEGALLRVLGTIERRGWNVLSVNAASTAQAYAVNVTLEGERDPEILCRQLLRLVDVREVTVVEPKVAGA